jgi:hypothetical protein
LGESAPTDAPFLRFEPLSQAEALWQEAEKTVAGDDELLARVRQGHLAVQYVWLSQWRELRQECAKSGVLWPLTVSRDDYARQWLATAQGVPGKPWTKLTTVSEGRLTPEEFISQTLSQP